MVLAGLLVVFGVLFTRIGGIHFDENGYLALAASSWNGDALRTGKLPFFYALNFVLQRGLGPLLGPWRPLTLFLVYGAANVLALVWFVRRMEVASGLLFSILLVSPLFLFVSSQLLMETPLLAILTVLMGAVFGAPRVAWLEVACVFSAVLLKENAAPAILAITLGCGTKDRRHGMRLGSYVIAALFIGELVRYTLHLPAQGYGGFSGLFYFSQYAHRLSFTSAYLAMVFFFVGPSLVFAWHGRRDFFATGVFAVMAVFAIQLGSFVHFARYLYPTLWVAIVAFTLVTLRTVSRDIASVLVALNLALSLNMWLPSGKAFAWWPDVIVKREGAAAEATLLPGFPVFGWFVKTAPIIHEPCFVIADPMSDRVRRTQELFSTLFPLARFSPCEGSAKSLNDFVSIVSAQ